MVCFDGVDDPGLLAETLGKLGTELGMVGLAFRCDSLADIVQQSSASCNSHIGSDLGGNHAGDDGNFSGVCKHVLAVAGSEEQSAECPDLFLAHVVDSEVEDNLVAFFGADAVDFLGNLGHYFLDSCRMDSSVLDKALEGDTCNLLADRVET